MKPLMSQFRSDLSVRLRDIAEKQVPAKLKPIVGTSMHTNQCFKTPRESLTWAAYNTWRARAGHLHLC